jgi:hypothetical protein
MMQYFKMALCLHFCGKFDSLPAERKFLAPERRRLKKMLKRLNEQYLIPDNQ